MEFCIFFPGRLDQGTTGLKVGGFFFFQILCINLGSKGCTKLLDGNSYGSVGGFWHCLLTPSVYVQLQE